jgi:hypothetical protein
MRTLSALPLLVTFSLSFVACLGVDDSVGRNLGLGALCGASGDCAANLECEVEHGVASCQPHGNTGAADAGAAPVDAPAGRGVGGACAVDLDCAADLECEVEHGVGACQPHGGR